MDVRRFFTALMTGGLSFFLVAAFAAATESRATKPEAVPPASLKTDLSPIPTKPSGTPADHRAGERSKSPSNGGISEIMGKDGAPMILVPAGEFVMGSDKGDEDEAPAHRVYLNA